MDKKALKEKIKKILQKKKEIIFAYLYGSFLENSNYNDIDVGIYVNEKKVKDFFNYEMDLYVELFEKLKKEVDIRILNRAPLGFIFYVLKGEILFTKNEKILTDLIEKVGMEYSEFSYLNKMYMEELFK